MEQVFNIYNNNSSKLLSDILFKTFDINDFPIIVCIGSDLAIGDSLAPIVGTKIYNLSNQNGIFVYGTLSKTITARESLFINSYLKHTHPNKKILAIDAAVGEENDIGLIKFKNKGIYPGAGVDKELEKIGDYSIIGVVSEKSVLNYSLFNLTRLNLIYNMAEIISQSIISFININSKNIRQKMY